jgi:pimeloyl-ACP methyl ester carboxylesterase
MKLAVLPAVAVAIGLMASGARAQPPSIDGDWDGALTVPAGIKVPLTLHITPAGATMDSPDQGARGVPVQLSRKGGEVDVDLPASKAHFAGRLAADGKTMSGPFTQGGMAMQASFTLRAPGAAPPERPRPQTPRPPFSYLTDDVTFPGGGGTLLAGTLSRPKGPGPFPAVVMIAGSGPQNRDETIDGHKLFLVIADRLTREGVAVLRYDKRGVGQSKGDYRTATQADFTADAAAAFVWLRRQPGINPRKVGLIGHSEGAEIAPKVADAGPGVAFLVLLSTPALPGVETIVDQQRDIALASGAPPATEAAASQLERQVLDADRAAPTPDAARTAVERILVDYGMPAARAAAQAAEIASPWYRAFLDDDPAPALRKLTGPVLVIAGSKDLQVSPAANLPVIRAALAHDPQAKIVELPGLNHLLQPAKTGTPQEYGQIETTIAPQALDLIAGWVAAQGR